MATPLARVKKATIEEVTNNGFLTRWQVAPSICNKFLHAIISVEKKH
jgi:hypothetical protein